MATNPTVLVDGTAAVVIDDAHWPVVIASWYGRPTESIIERYFSEFSRTLMRARKGGERVVLINDTFASERPDPLVRKRIVAFTEAHGALQDAVVMKNFVVIENPVIRGVVTALAWVDPKLGTLTHVGSLAEAVEGAATTLRSFGISVPPGLTPGQVVRRSRPTAA